MLLLLVLSALILLCAAGYRPAVRRYELKSPKIRRPVRLALISDLHSCRYGRNQSRLIRLIEAQNADAVFLAGDIVDDKLPEYRAYAFAASWP